MSNTNLSMALHLTKDDIFNLRGKPFIKRVEATNAPTRHSLEEWIYFSARNNSEEHYFFENGLLSGYKK